jgi:methionyl-tRNA formyltransferase
MRIVFFGSADFGIPALERLTHEHTVVAVVSSPAKPQGRGLRRLESPVAFFARGLGLTPILTPDDVNGSDLHRELAGSRADIFIVAAFRILPKALFSLPPLGTLNIHASLLPKYRGPAPIQRAVEAGEKETGVTVFRIDEGIDSGGILLQKRVPIGPDETSIDLYHKLSNCGAGLLAETLEGLGRGTLRPVPQDDALASRAPKLTKAEARIDWRQPATEISNKIRAFRLYPGTYALYGGKRLEIERAQAIDIAAPGDTGTIIATGDSFFDVKCLKGILRVFEVKPESRRSMNVKDFLKGKSIAEGEHLA